MCCIRFALAVIILYRHKMLFRCLWLQRATTDASTNSCCCSRIIVCQNLMYLSMFNIANYFAHAERRRVTLTLLLYPWVYILRCFANPFASVNWKKNRRLIAKRFWVLRFTLLSKLKVDEYAKYVGYVFPISPCMDQFQLAIQTTLRRKDVGTSNMFWAK